METTNKAMDIQSLLRGILRDDWMVKTGIGGILGAASLVAILYSPICLPLSAALVSPVSGYCLRAMRTKAGDPEAKLPDWNDWSDLFISGCTWIALQCFVWTIAISLAFLLFTLLLCQAYYAKSSNLSAFYCFFASSGFLVCAFVLSLISSYTMVHFALEENSRAGLAFLKIARALFKKPKLLLAGFLLAWAVQLLCLLLPLLTLVGIFLLPSAAFIGQLISSVILAAHWAEFKRTGESES